MVGHRCVERLPRVLVVVAAAAPSRLASSLTTLTTDLQHQHDSKPADRDADHVGNGAQVSDEAARNGPDERDDNHHGRYAHSGVRRRDADVGGRVRQLYCTVLRWRRLRRDVAARYESTDRGSG